MGIVVKIILKSGLGGSNSTNSKILFKKSSKRKILQKQEKPERFSKGKKE